MRISQENQLVRLQLLCNGNFGAAGGKVTLDRPTQTDAHLGLPFIPNSSLRGVWRNWWEVRATALAAADSIFGTRDDPEKPKRLEPSPGKLIVGNGDLLCFPLLSETGERCHVFPFHNICKYVELEKLCGQSPGINLKTIATAIYAGQKNHRFVLGMPRWPAFNTHFTLEQANVTNALLQIVHNLLKRWLGDWLADNDILLVVDDLVATYLWQRASEVRDLTALESNKTVRSQSLRRVETVPEGSIFLSLVTWLGQGDLDFGSETLQIGSGEGLGNGFCRLAAMETTAAAGATLPLQDGAHGPRERDDRSMSDMYQEIMTVAQLENAKYKQKVRSAIGSFGWRIKQEGWEQALAFALAKAKPSAQNTTEDAQAYRWLLRTLLKVDGTLTTWNGKEWFSDQVRADEMSLLLQRWIWLRKFSEVNLPPTTLE